MSKKTHKISMKTPKYLSLLIALAVTATAFTSCLKDDDTTEDYAGLCHVNNVILGSMKRYIPFKKADGTDTVSVSTVQGSTYPLTIDQVGHRIFNCDSLPTYTHVDKVTFTNFTCQGTATIKSLTTGNDTIFATTDSTDLRQQREITIHGFDGSSTMTYTMELRVHQEEGDSVRWHQQATATPAQGLDDLRLMTRGDSLVAWGTSEGGTVVLWALRSNAGEWQKSVIGENAPLPASIVKQADTFYGLTATHVVKSADGLVWTSVSQRPEGLGILAGASTRSLYGIGAQGFLRSTDHGNTWTADAASRNDSIPVADVRALARPTLANSDVEEIILVGTAPGGRSVAWKRNEMRTAELEGVADFRWTHISAENGNHRQMPNVSLPSLAFYGGGAALLGTKTNGYAALYLSDDTGRSWDPTRILLPQLPTQAKAVMTTDNENFIWVLCGADGQLWRGRLNRLGWKDANAVR